MQKKGSLQLVLFRDQKVSLSLCRTANRLCILKSLLSRTDDVCSGIRRFKECMLSYILKELLSLPRRHGSSRGFWRDWHQVRVQVHPKHKTATQTPRSLWEVRHVHHLSPAALLLHHQLLPAGVLAVWVDGPRWACQDKTCYSHHEQRS